MSNRDDVPSLLPGDVLGGKYRIEARLAEGGMGVVMRATHLDLDCPVAIKLLRSELSTNEDVVARLLAEARIAASLRSKHVNRVLDVGRTTTGVPYLVLEYLEGSDLGGYLERRGALPISEAVDYLLQACEALAEAHAIGIVHRDMKPENLFLAEEADGGFVLKVLDFGISKAPAGRRGGRSVTNPFEVVGSPTYMSPEQVRGGNVDARTDVWALGAVLHELCTAEIFFDEETVTSTFKRILDPADVPAPLEGGDEATRVHEIIVRCLQREPEQRFQDMVELAQALSPLGTDALSAARVAKVAAAARARVIAVGSGSPSSPATPLALTTSRVDLSPMAGVTTSAPKRRWRTWSVVAAAAVAAAVSGANHFTQAPRAASLPPTLAPTAIRVSGTTSLLQEPVLEHAVTAPAAIPSASEAAGGEVPVAPRWGAVPPARAVAALGTPRPTPTLAHVQPARPEPSPVSGPEKEAQVEPAPSDAELAAHEEASVATSPEAAELAPPAATAPSHASFDAWDPTTFGGRK